MPDSFQLEPEAQAFVDMGVRQPFLFHLGLENGRSALNEMQSGPVNRLPVEIEDLRVKDGPSDQVSIRILRPPNPSQKLPVILYLHGAGWVSGSEHTHDRLIRELTVRAEAAVVFPRYSLSPEAKYPTAIEEIYSVAKWVEECGARCGLDTQRICVAGDNAGGNLAAAITLLAKERGGPSIGSQLLFCPVTNAVFDTPSYDQFGEGYPLHREAMMWFWDQYTTNPGERRQITASPLRASIAQLKGLPTALVITAEADVLRDEGEAYANKLREAGVRVLAVRFQGTIHDFVMLNFLANSAAARGALALAAAWLRDGFAQRETGKNS